MELGTSKRRLIISLASLILHRKKKQERKKIKKPSMEEQTSLYHRLPNNSIRLLYLRHQDSTEQLVGELQTVQLRPSSSPRYTAISYVWGDDTALENRSVEVNGKPVRVLKSAYPILQKLASEVEYGDHNGFALWIDSICINQSDLRERARQVAMMGRIFGQASRVVIWLGEAHHGRDEKAAEIVRSIAKAVDDPDLDELKFHDVDSWKALEEIALRPWFRRAWTLQESLVPRGEVLFYCGNEILQEREMSNAISKGEELRRKHLPPDVGLDERSFAAMSIRRRIVQWYLADDLGEEISLLALMAYHSHAECSDPRDQVYALLGCVNETDRQIVGMPDYSSSTEEVYTNLVKKWIDEYRNFDIICFAQLFPPKPGNNLPSWVPDWRNRISWSPSAVDTNPLPLLVSQSTNSRIGNLRPRRFNPPKDTPPSYSASGSMDPVYGFDADDKVLFCNGVFVGTIDGITALVDSSGEIIEPAIQSTSPANSSTAAESEKHTLASELAIPGDISWIAEMIRREVALSLILGRGDVYLHHPADPQRVLAHISDLLSKRASAEFPSTATQEALAWFDSNSGFQIRGLNLGEAFRRMPLSQAYIDAVLQETAWYQVENSEEEGYEHAFASKFELAASPRHMSMRLCVTEQGTMGMVPQRARKGDSVCVLIGCSVPVVLRRQEGGLYEFVGECYLQNFMDGEALMNGYQAQTFGLV